MNKDARRVSLLVFSASLFVAALPAAAQTWTGAGADNNWSTGANWSGGVPPASGPATQVTFPVGGPRRSPVVDAPWTVNQLIFEGGGYTISGQPITFDGGVANISSTGGSTNTLSNPIVLAVRTFIGGSANFVAFTGPISGPGSLNVGGNGATLLASSSTFTGGVVVVGGVLALAGSMPGPVGLVSLGVFSGSGTVTGSVTVAGANATFNLGAPLSIGGLRVSLGSFIGVPIDGRNAGQYGSVSVNGTAEITDATLKVVGSYVPVPGDVFTIIVNDGTDPVIGTFAGLPEGATISFNGAPLRISYIGGTGNDVTLSAVGAIDSHQVPILSEWGLIILAALVIGMGMLTWRPR